MVHMKKRKRAGGVVRGGVGRRKKRIKQCRKKSIRFEEEYDRIQVAGDSKPVTT
jgi:hypothetical protein